MISTYNKNDVPISENGRSRIEVLYASNDSSEAEYDNFISLHRNWGCLSWNDKQIAELKKIYGINTVPTVIVFDKNLKCVTMTGADDLL